MTTLRPDPAVRSAALGPQSLGEALRMLRHRVRLSRDDLAHAAEVSAGTISNYENDVSSPTAVALRRVARVLASHLGQDPASVWEQLGALLDGDDQDVSAGSAGMR